MKSAVIAYKWLSLRAVAKQSVSSWGKAFKLFRINQTDCFPAVAMTALDYLLLTHLLPNNPLISHYLQNIISFRQMMNIHRHGI
jgi:hypothetical protein